MKVKDLIEVIRKTNKEFQIVAVKEGREIGLESIWRNYGELDQEFSFLMRDDGYEYSFIDVCKAKHILQYEMEMNPIDLFRDKTNLSEYEFLIDEKYDIERIEVTDKVRLIL